MSIEKVPIFGAEPYGFKATDISGCRVWLDASDVSTTYSVLPATGMVGYTDYTSANTQNLLVWQDKSSGGNDFIKNVDPTNIQDTSQIYQGPTIVAPDSYLTPVAVLNFDQGNNTGGGGDAGGASNEPRFLQQNLVAVGGYTGYSSAIGPRVGTGISATTDIFVVVRPKFLTVAGDVFSIGGRTNQTADFTSLSITSSGYWKIRSPGGVRDVTSSVIESFSSFSNVAGEDSGYRILHMSLSNNNYVLRRMGSIIGSNNTYTWSPNLANYRYYIGRANSQSSPGNYFNGKIGEICVYNNIITTEKRLIIESFMAKRWNLVDLLPLDHPARLTNIPIFLRGMSLAAAPNGYTKRGNMVKIFVEAPQPPTVNDPVISAGGITFTVTWASYVIPVDYYFITVNNSTDNSTWNTVAYIPYFVGTSYVYRIGSVDNKYYQAIIQSKNRGGSALTTTDSVLNSVPAPPSPFIPTVVSTSDLYMHWDIVYPGGDPSSYTVYLYISTDTGATFTQTNIYTTSSTNYTVTAKCVLFEQYKFKVSASNSIGTSAQSVFSSTFTYNGAGG